MAEQDDHRHCEAAIDGAHRLGQTDARIAAFGQFHGEEQEGFDPSRVEPVAIEQAGLAADLLVGDLEHNLDSVPGVEQSALPLGQRFGGHQPFEERRDAARIHRSSAAVAERIEECRRAFTQRPLGCERRQGFSQVFKRRFGVHLALPAFLSVTMNHVTNSKFPATSGRAGLSVSLAPRSRPS